MTHAIRSCAAQPRLTRVALTLVAAIASFGGTTSAHAGPSDAASRNWESYGRTDSQQRFSPLNQISTRTIDKLGLKWALELPDEPGFEATPLAIDGVLYFTGRFSVVYAVDARSGTLRWKFDPHTIDALLSNPDRMRIARGSNRGVAHWNGSIYVGTADGRLIALSAATGKQLWSVQTLDPNTPRAISGAPLVFKDKVLIGHGGADVGAVRGYVTAYDVRSGEQRWRFFVVPGDPKAGFENEAMAMAAKTWTGEWWRQGGGGTVWNGMTYDPEFNRIYLGTGNGAPWNHKVRSPGGGDNLFLSSIVALDADTGAYAWHYQESPGETWDHNSNMDLVLADLSIDGKRRKALLHAPKNGFFYVLDRRDGKLLSAEKIGKVTWAERVDLASGRPVELPGARLENGEALIWPGAAGAHSWMPMSFNPGTGLTYIPTIDAPSYYSDKGIDAATWQHTPFEYSTGFSDIIGSGPVPEGMTSWLLAWDPVTQRERWRVRQPGLWPGGTLTTQGNLVFQGRGDGKFVAYDARDGKVMWQFDAGMGIDAPPISYQLGDQQYISVLVGIGGENSFGSFGSFGISWPYRGGRRLLTFALNGSAKLPAEQHPAPTPLDVPSFVLDTTKVQQGFGIYHQKCAVCHGMGVVAGGATPDLRASGVTQSFEAMRSVVLDGALQRRGMPKFVALSSAELEQIQHYIRYEARQAVTAGQPVPTTGSTTR